jgi:putative component of toxin-antitoxin plasmid stabilization module
MDIYFNPYPKPTDNIKQAIACALGTANALGCLSKLIGKGEIVSVESNTITDCIIYFDKGISQYFKNLLISANSVDKKKLIGLMQACLKGRIIANESSDAWVVFGIGVSAPVLTQAAKSGAVSLTIPTSPGWDVDCIKFEGREEQLFNIWGQKDLSTIHKHYIKSINSARDRFAMQFNATYCDGALNTAPNEKYWDSYKFFTQMEKAKNRNFEIDNDLLVNIGDTKKHGVLYELRCYGDGWRIFFACDHGSKDKLLIGGFFPKGTLREQNKKIEQAIDRINTHF